MCFPPSITISRCTRPWQQLSKQPKRVLQRNASKPWAHKTTHWSLQWGIHPAAIAASALEMFPLPQSGSSKPSSCKRWAGKRCSGYLLLLAAAIKVKGSNRSTILCQALAERCCSSFLVTRTGLKWIFHLCFHWGGFFSIAVIFTTWWRVFYIWHWWVQVQTST